VKKTKKPQTLKSLQAEWDSKLKRSGFKDLENRRTGLLHEWESSKAKRLADSGKFQEKERYYQLAGQFLHDHKFVNLEHEIWRLHSEGDSVRTIVKKIKAAGKHTYRFQVHAIIKSLRKTMFEKVSLPDDFEDTDNE
jgi:hypothetical protein